MISDANKVIILYMFLSIMVLIAGIVLNSPAMYISSILYIVICLFAFYKIKTLDESERKKEFDIIGIVTFLILIIYGIAGSIIIYTSNW